MIQVGFYILMAISGIDITLPYKFTPRDYQIPFLRAMDNGCKRAVLVWHRRAGKDKTTLQAMIKRSAERPGGYYYYFPTGSLGRKVIWEGKDNEGMPFLDHFPPGSIKRKNDTEMLVETVWGAHFRILGTDRLDVVGTNPVGLVFSEYSLQDPRAWQLVQPILRANDGWAVFCYTPRGRNHGYTLSCMAKSNPAEWFCQALTVEDTGAIPVKEIESDIARGIISRPLARQEYWCDFSLGQEGCYYATQLQWLEEHGRITTIEHDPRYPVFTTWDPGFTTAIWFWQPAPVGLWHMLRYYEASGQDMGQYAVLLDSYRDEYRYRYGQHFAPFDVDNNQYRLVAAEGLKEIAWRAGIRFTDMEMERSVDAGIERTREFMRSCVFDEDGCRVGLSRLSGYEQAINKGMSTPDQNVYLAGPAKNGCEHGADAFRYVSKAVRLVNPDRFQDQYGPQRIIATSRRQKLPVMHRMGF